MNRRPTPARVRHRVHRTRTRPQTDPGDPIEAAADTAVDRAAPVDRVLWALDTVEVAR